MAEKQEKYKMTLDVARRVSRIENFFSMLITQANITDKTTVFVGELPPTTKTTWESMVLVDVNRQTDYDAYADCSATIYLYARPTGEGPTKNVKLLDTMEKALDAAIANSSEAYFNWNYVLQVNWRDSDYDSTRNFHYDVVNVSVFIKGQRL